VSRAVRCTEALRASAEWRPAPGVECRRVRAGEGARLRAVRLRALQDAPGAFATTFEQECRRPQRFWTKLARASDRAEDRLILVIDDGRQWTAMAATHWFDRPAGIAQLWGLWVQAPDRGTGVASRLVADVSSWAYAQGGNLLRLGVIERAAELEDFYRRLGFTRTGETKSLPSGGQDTAFFMARRLRREG
jgi:GNAT superfamily N-acetyltransferase